MKQTVYLIGIGGGSLDTVTIGAQKAIEQSEILFGAPRMLTHPVAQGKKTEPLYRPKAILDYLQNHKTLKVVSVLFSGDSGFYSGATALREQLKSYCEVITICGISSVQLFCASLGVSWDDAYLCSLHGREHNFIQAVKTQKKVFALTGGNHSSQALCSQLCKHGLGDVSVCVGERLSYPDERITKGTASELSKKEYDTLSVIFVEQTKAVASLSHGIEDREFIRGEVPMTKMEVRSVSLSKLRVAPDDVVYDIGAGTGSVAIEASLLAPYGSVYAIEKNEKALELIKQNSEKFGCENLHMIAGVAPQILEELPPPDCVFIGGSSGNLSDILGVLKEKNPLVRMVINAIALESLAGALEALKQQGFSAPNVTLVSVSRDNRVGEYTMMKALNPIYILTANGT